MYKDAYFKTVTMGKERVKKAAAKIAESMGQRLPPLGPMASIGDWDAALKQMYKGDTRLWIATKTPPKKQ